MLTLLISMVLLISLSFAFQRKKKFFATDLLILFAVFIIALSLTLDPLNLDKGSLKFSGTDIQNESIERFPNYIGNILGGIDTIDTVNATLKTRDITIHGEVRIGELEKTLNGYMIKFTDGRGMLDDIDYTLFFYENEWNNILSTKTSGDIIRIYTGSLNSVSFSDKRLSSISFKECEVLK